MTRGLLFYRLKRWMFHGEYEYVERRIVRAMILAVSLLLLSGFIRSILEQG
jgi:hypothetical protein